jgi:hypothetical protein
MSIKVCRPTSPTSIAPFVECAYVSEEQAAAPEGEPAKESAKSQPERRTVVVCGIRFPQ